MIDKAKGTIGGLTDLGLALLALAIVLTLLVGAGNMAFFGGVVGNITALVAELGSSGLPGLVAVGIILGYSKDRYLVPRAITICLKAY